MRLHVSIDGNLQAAAPWGIDLVRPGAGDIPALIIQQPSGEQRRTHGARRTQDWLAVLQGKDNRERVFPGPPPGSRGRPRRP